MIHLPTCRTLAAVVLAAALSAPAALADEPSFELTIREHAFTPETLEVPANARIKLIVINADPTPEEFESVDLDREKLIPGNSQAIVYIGPVDAGT